MQNISKSTKRKEEEENVKDAEKYSEFQTQNPSG